MSGKPPSRLPHEIIGFPASTDNGSTDGQHPYARDNRRWYAFAILFVAVNGATVVFYWRFFIQWLSGIRGRNWPTISTTIDIVTVVRQADQSGRAEIFSYLATLTYFYRNPDLQTGEYCRIFHGDEEADAPAWADSYKGSTVMIHVDPRDPTRSVLRSEEL